MLELKMRVSHDYDNRKHLYTKSDDGLNRKLKILYIVTFGSITVVLILGFVLPTLTDRRIQHDSEQKMKDIVDLSYLITALFIVLSILLTACIITLISTLKQHSQQFIGVNMKTFKNEIWNLQLVLGVFVSSYILRIVLSLTIFIKLFRVDDTSTF
jgi:hypothetical protein